MVTVALPKVSLCSPRESLWSRVSNVILFFKGLPKSSCNSFYLTAMIEFNSNNNDDDDDDETNPTFLGCLRQSLMWFFSSSWGIGTCACSQQHKILCTWRNWRTWCGSTVTCGSWQNFAIAQDSQPFIKRIPEESSELTSDGERLLTWGAETNRLKI